MASEYLRKIAREQPPPEPKRELTPAEKRRNWLHYNKWWLIAGAVLLAALGSILWGKLSVRPADYVFAYVAETEMAPEAAAAFEAHVAALARDKNGDGRVIVELRQYVTPHSGDIETAFHYEYAASVRLLADIEKQDSYFFLTDDPAALQLSHQILANADGSAPDKTDYGVADKVYAWADCPGLRELDNDRASALYLGRRFFWGETGADREAEEALWQALTKGVSP